MYTLTNASKPYCPLCLICLRHLSIQIHNTHCMETVLTQPQCFTIYSGHFPNGTLVHTYTHTHTHTHTHTTALTHSVFLCSFLSEGVFCHTLQKAIAGHSDR